MTNERQTNETGVERDALVSETYREVARERAPEHLNKTVLDAARKAARPRYSVFRAWTRPVAWAATIVLSVALVLNLTQVPPQQPAVVDPAAKSERADRDIQQLKVQDADMLQRAEEMARSQTGPNDQPAKATADLEERVAAPAPAFAVSSKASLEGPAAAVEELGACDAEAMADPESWLECIIELEAAGLTEIASKQRALLAEAFPDFDSR